MNCSGGEDIRFPLRCVTYGEESQEQTNDYEYPVEEISQEQLWGLTLYRGSNRNCLII